MNVDVIQYICLLYDSEKLRNVFIQSILQCQFIGEKLTFLCCLEWAHVKRENAVGQLVEALRYKPEGRGFNSMLRTKEWT